MMFFERRDVTALRLRRSGLQLLLHGKKRRKLTGAAAREILCSWNICNAGAFAYAEYLKSLRDEQKKMIIPAFAVAAPPLTSTGFSARYNHLFFLLSVTVFRSGWRRTASTYATSAEDSVA